LVVECIWADVEIIIVKAAAARASDVNHYYNYQGLALRIFTGVRSIAEARSCEAETE